MRFIGVTFKAWAASLALMTFVPSVSAQQFQNAVAYSTQAASPVAVAAGDFNNDGRLDMVVQCSRVLDIFFALQNGAFGKLVPTLTVGFENSVAVADFNQDGNADVVTSNRYQDGEISVLLGNGDGTFLSNRQYLTGRRYTQAAAVADLNNDGIIDIVASNGGKKGSISVFLGKGDGTFQSPVTYAMSGAARWVAIADFNGDGSADVAVTVGSGVRVLLGVGDGTFLPYVEYPARFSATNVSAADMNSDGRMDLVVASPAPGIISVLLGKGDGTFAPKKDTRAGALSLAVADFNHDGNLDVVTLGCSDSCQPGNAELLLGNGDGHFQPPTFYAAGDDPDAVMAADFSRDGFADLAVADYTGSQASVLLNTGNQ